MKTKKNTAPITSEFTPQLASAGGRRFRFSAALSMWLLAGGALLGPVGGVYAQFPSAPENENVNSMGVLQIDTSTSTLTPAQLSALFDPGTSGYTYPGWVNSRYLVSPILYDDDTCIAAGGASRRLISDYTGNISYPLGFPQTVGAAGVSSPPLSLPLSSDSISAYTDYGGFLPVSGDFSGIYGVGAGPRECLTEIQAFNLSTFAVCSNACVAQTPCPLSYPPGADTTFVRAGYNNTYNGGAPFNAAYTPHSLGMVDSQSTSGNSANDFPANSFFDIYPEITLPPVTSTMSIGIIPLSGAVLTTAGYPLIIEAQSIMGMPPSVVYIHQTTDFGVNLVFRDTCPNLNPASVPPNQPYWSAGDVLGTVTLAGHNPGVNDPCSKAGTITTFVNEVFGLPSQLAQSAVIGLVFDNNNFPPSPTSSYASAPGTNFDGSSLDSVEFTNGVTTYHVRNISFSSFIDPIPLPAYGSSATYTNTNTVVSLWLSTDGQNFISGSATGQVQILIVNTNPPTAPTKVYYYSQLISFNGSGSSLAGSFKVRQSPTKISPGLLIVQTNSGSNYKIGGFLNTSLEWSFNGGISYVAADRPIELKHETAVNCGSVQPNVTIVMVSPGTAKITWNSGSYRLQSSPSLTPPAWTDIPVTSPYVFSIGTTNLYYRATCP